MSNTSYISKRMAKSLIVFYIVKTERAQWKETKTQHKTIRKSERQKKRQYRVKLGETMKHEAE